MFLKLRKHVFSKVTGILRSIIMNFSCKTCHTFLVTLGLGFLMEIEFHQASEYWH